MDNRVYRNGLSSEDNVELIEFKQKKAKVQI